MTAKHALLGSQNVTASLCALSQPFLKRVAERGGGTKKALHGQGSCNPPRVQTQICCMREECKCSDDEPRGLKNATLNGAENAGNSDTCSQGWSQLTWPMKIF